MRLPATLLALLLVPAAALHADALGELKSLLNSGPEKGPVSARVDYSFRHQEGDDKEAVKMEGKAGALVEDSALGMRILWDRATMDTAARELAARAADPERKTPTRHVMDALDPQTLSDYLDAVPNLLRKLENAQLVEEREDQLDGLRLRLLVLRLQPKLSAQDRKYVKQTESTARLWLGPDGRPVATESHFYVKGRIMLVVGFETTEDSRLRFGTIAGRLVVLHHEKSTVSSGGGEKSSETVTSDLRVEATGTR